MFDPTRQPVDPPHWHEQNPWNDHLVYVPLEELAACSLPMTLIKLPSGDDHLVPQMGHNGGPEWHMVEAIALWTQYGEKLDAYILTGPTLTAGVRFGPEGEHYITHSFSLPKLAALLEKYRPKRKREPIVFPAPNQGITPEA